MTLLGCDKEPLKPEWAGWGEVSVTRNGSKWTNAAAAVLLVKAKTNNNVSNYIDLQFYKFSDGGIIRESLHLGTVSTQSTGRYQLVKETSSNCGNNCTTASYQTDDDDIRISAYSFDPGQPSYLEITAYDSTTHRIEGKFQVGFTKQAAYKNSDPTTVVFESGTFSAPVNDKGRFE
ncbi:hypothetical protein GCM10028809_60650 [Spirosoma gilvum]